jgi:hypothetical protein
MKKLALIIGVAMVVFLAANAGFAGPRDGRHGGHVATYSHGGHHGGYYGGHGYYRGYYPYYRGYGYYSGSPYIIGGSGIYVGIPFGPGLFFRAYPY